MTARFVLCACERHGRLVGGPGTVPIEIASREMASALFGQADANGVFAPGAHADAKREVARSLLALKEAGIEDDLRLRVTLWNVAAASTNDPDAFAATDFHAYHALVDGFGDEGPQPP